jgi:agmatinase
MVDPLERWRELGLPDKPDYAGLLTYAGMPYTQDPLSSPVSTLR